MKTINTDEEATAIYSKIGVVTPKNMGFIIVTFWDGKRVIGIYDGASMETKSRRAILKLKNALGVTTTYDIYTIKDVD